MAFRDEIQALADRFRSAVARKDGAACAALYADPAVKINPGGQVVMGRAGIAADFQALFDGGDFRVTGIEVRHCRSEGGTGFAILLVRTDGGEFFVMIGVERNREGNWLIEQEVINGA